MQLSAPQPPPTFTHVKRFPSENCVSVRIGGSARGQQETKLSLGKLLFCVYWKLTSHWYYNTDEARICFRKKI